MFLILLILTEVYKFFSVYEDWDTCYKKNIIYSYSDFISHDFRVFSWLYFLYFVISCYIFYYIFVFNIILYFFFLFIPIKISRGYTLFNIFVYHPYLWSRFLKKLLLERKVNKKTILKIILVNFITIFIWGFPRFILNYSYITILIIESYKNNPEVLNIKEFLNYVYISTYEESINKLDSIL